VEQLCGANVHLTEKAETVENGARGKQEVGLGKGIGELP